jgi:hypothetical protein
MPKTNRKLKPKSRKRKLRSSDTESDSSSSSSSSDSETEEKKSSSESESDKNDELMWNEVHEPFLIEAPPEQPASHRRTGTKPIHPNLPQPPFSVLVVGPRKGGKSVFLHNLLDKKKKKKDGRSYGAAFIFDNIVLYSPTYQYDKTLEDLELIHVFDPTVPLKMIVEEIKKKQQIFRLTNSMADVLLVLEDVTNIPEVWTTMADLGFRGRHFGINVLAVAHKMSSINRGVRTQTQQWMLFKPHEESEMDWILYTFARKKTKQIFENAFDRAWDIKYNFIYIDFERDGGIENKYRSGLNEPLFSPSEISMMERVKLYKPDGELIKDTGEDDEKLPDPDKKRPISTTTAKTDHKQTKKPRLRK